MKQPVGTIIHQEQCIGCGECVRVCPTGAIGLRDGVAQIVGDRSLYCGHCVAVCPVGAVELPLLSDEALAFASFKSDDRWLPHGQPDVAQLVRLMRSRRSCRNYQEKPVPRQMLEDLVKVGITAPSGTNSQRWTFTILPTRRAVMALANPIGDFFRELNQKAAKPWLRGLLKALGKPDLDIYFREHFDSVQEALAEWEATGRERLFHGAPAAIIVASKPGASCPAEDALLASGQIILAAHAMGLGSCLIGYVVAVMKNQPKLKQLAGIPDEETVYACIALGWPEETWQSQTGRLPVTPRYFEG
jgi:nitroreductase/NAD-dependent dihydropyrimidine dehydrogenase PreA subunit